MATHSSILVWEIPWTEDSGGLQVHRVAESGTTERLTQTHTFGQSVRTVMEEA